MKMKLTTGPLLLSYLATPKTAAAFSSLHTAADFAAPSADVAVRRAPPAAPAPAAPALRAPRAHASLGLVTFDLDDSLYPLGPVLADANRVLVQVMAQYGCAITDADIVAGERRLRAEAGPVAGAALSHTAVRTAAIRREMERHAPAPVRDADVERVYAAWERERHHSAERHMYPGVLAALQQLKRDHPHVVVGAVTDGKANPLHMVFSLAPYFDFCMSWEDDAAGRTDFCQELGAVDGDADLRWIYRAAYDKYTDLAARKGRAWDDADDAARPAWIHVGDDLAYDVGGSAACGARTVLLDLDEEYGQTAKGRFLWGDDGRLPAWNTASYEELSKRKAMNDAAEPLVDKRVNRLTLLPNAIDDILHGW